jgi:WD40 repeat protein
VFPVEDALVLVVAGGGATLFDLQTGSILWEIDCPATCGALSPDQRWLALGWGTEVYLWDVHSGTLLHTLRGHKDLITSLAFAPDGDLLASGSEDTTVWLWKVTDGAPVHTLVTERFEQVEDESGPYKLAVSGARVNSLAFTPDGKILTGGSQDAKVWLWQTADGEILHILNGHESSVTTVAFGATGEILASGSDDKTVRVWRVTDGEAIRTLVGHEETVTSVAFSSDGRALVSGSYDRTVRLWQLSDGAASGTLVGHEAQVVSVAFTARAEMI